MCSLSIVIIDILLHIPTVMKEVDAFAYNCKPVSDWIEICSIFERANQYVYSIS